MTRYLKQLFTLIDSIKNLQQLLFKSKKNSWYRQNLTLFKFYDILFWRPRQPDIVHAMCYIIISNPMLTVIVQHVPRNCDMNFDTALHHESHVNFLWQKPFNFVLTVSGDQCFLKWHVTFSATETPVTRDKQLNVPPIWVYSAPSNRSHTESDVTDIDPE